MNYYMIIRYPKPGRVFSGLVRGPLNSDDPDVCICDNLDSIKLPFEDEAGLIKNACITTHEHIQTPEDSQKSLEDAWGQHYVYEVFEVEVL